jgi:hypothetical protein
VAAEHGPGRLPTGADGLSKAKRAALVRASVTDYDDHGREVLLKSTRARAVPAEMKATIDRVNRELKRDKENNFGAQVDSLFEIYKSATDHTIVGYFARASSSAEGISYERDLAFDLKGKLLFDDEEVG